MAGDHEPEELTPHSTQSPHDGPKPAGRPGGSAAPGAAASPAHTPAGTSDGDAFTAWLKSWPADCAVALCRIDPRSKRMMGKNGIERRRIDSLLADGIGTEHGCATALLARYGGGAFRWSVILPDGTAPNSGGTYTLDAGEPERGRQEQSAPVAPGSDAVELRRLDIEAAERAHQRALELRRLDIEAEERRAEREEAQRRREIEERRVEDRRAESLKAEVEERRANRDMQNSLMNKLLEQKPATTNPGPDLGALMTQMAQANATSMASMSQTLMEAQLAVFRQRTAEPTDKTESIADLIREALPPIAGAIASRLRQPAAAAPASPAPQVARSEVAAAPVAPPALPSPALRTVLPTAPASAPEGAEIDSAERLRRKAWSRRVLSVLDTLQAVQMGAMPDDVETLAQVAASLPPDLADLVQQRDQAGTIEAVQPVAISSQELTDWIESPGVALWLADYLSRVADQLTDWVVPNLSEESAAAQN